MAYNPTRVQGGQHHTRRVVPEKGMALKQSEIERSRGLGILAPPGGANVPTGFGFAAPMFGGKDFAIRYEQMLPRANVGFGVNPKADRVVMVRRGVVFLIVETADGMERTPVQAGGWFCAQRGRKHGWSTGESPAELLVIESANFKKTWEQLEEPVRVDVDGLASVGAADVAPAPLSVVTPPDGPVRHELPKTRAKDQAAMLALQRAQTKSHVPNKGSSYDAAIRTRLPDANTGAIGVNLAPEVISEE